MVLNEEFDSEEAKLQYEAFCEMCEEYMGDMNKAFMLFAKKLFMDRFSEDSDEMNDDDDNESEQQLPDLIEAAESDEEEFQIKMPDREDQDFEYAAIPEMEIPDLVDNGDDLEQVYDWSNVGSEPYAYAPHFNSNQISESDLDNMSGGAQLGLPDSVYVNFTPRGEADSLINTFDGRYIE